MQSGILDGYDILVDGQHRSFRDMEAVAYEAARFLKIASRYKDRVEIVARSTGKRIDVVA